MNKAEFSQLVQRLNETLDPAGLLPQWLPSGKRVGKEWVSANPTRNDSNPGSFTISMLTGVWKDYATGDGGRDLVSLYAYLHHNDNQGEAAKELAANMGIRVGEAPMVRPDAPNVKRIEEAQPTPVIPVPADAPACRDFKHPTHGEPSRVWEYRDLAGNLMLYICRFDPADGSRKQISPRSWCEHPGKPSRWTWRGVTGQAKRPLYGLDRLGAMPEADAIVVEGEKAADAGQALMGDAAAVVSWMGGVETAGRVDVSALAGRCVYLFPDFDAQRVKPKNGEDPDSMPLLPLHEQPGMRAMLDIAKALHGVAREVHMVGYSIDPAYSGWDLADAQDAGWDGAKLLRYIAKNTGDPAVKSVQPKPANDNTPEYLPLTATVNIYDWADKSEKNAPMNTLENVEYMLGEYGIKARYNQIKKAVEVTLPGREYTADNRANCSLAEITSIAARNRMPQSMLPDYIKLLADRNAYNPVADWITSQPWDGVERIKQLQATIKAHGDAKLKDALMYRWLLSAVAAVFMPSGFEGHGCLVLTGAQGTGKTTWFRRLAPAELVLVGAMLDPADKDTVTNAVSHWIVELGELDATFRKADIARLKSFIPKSVDKLRRPYDRVESEYQRRTVFGASVNEDRYLVDDTGNRRWWTINVASIDYAHQIDMQQLWAEVLVHFQRGEQHYLTPEENDALGQLNTEHEAIDPVEEQILTAFKWDEPLRPQRMTASDVLSAIGYDKPNKSQATHASKVLKKLTGGEPKKSGSSRFFELPVTAKAARQRRTDENDDRPF